MFGSKGHEGSREDREGVPVIDKQRKREVNMIEC